MSRFIHDAIKCLIVLRTVKFAGEPLHFDFDLVLRFVHLAIKCLIVLRTVCFAAEPWLIHVDFVSAEASQFTLQINFLMVGHTHEDIDGLFGLLASKLKNLNAFTTFDMNALFALAGKSATNVQERGSRSGVGIDNCFLPRDLHKSRHWNVIADWRSWLQVWLYPRPCTVEPSFIQTIGYANIRNVSHIFAITSRVVPSFCEHSCSH